MVSYLLSTHNFMATNTNNGGGSHNHLSSSSSTSLDGSPYRHMYFSRRQNSGQANDMDTNKLVPPIVFAVFAVIIWAVCSRVLRTDTVEQEAATGGGDDDTAARQLQSNEAGDDDGWVDRAPSSTTVAGAAAVEMVRPSDEPPLVCTYRKADGWREGSCGVCLADLDDGEAVRVLPACMHYFHAACVGKWLRVHATCPLCRAPLVSPADATT
ncbi:E3 ubiquitin-protein ligase EL5 [Sorghum bicolor]|nr:E3 ubiquitin-protein ligase EL5 [Sorghum bicolor]|eukprot:XP_002450052.2 E3 ubiquitin-protein ligase EL5 [Sorghum bicolor]